MADREVLIFWCLKRVRWKNILFFRVGSNWWVGSSQTESLMEWVSNNPKQLWHPKISPISNETPLQTPKNKKDTTRYQQRMPNVFKHSHHPLNMHDWVRLEPILHFGKTVKGKNFRPQNIKTSLSTTSKNHWVWPFFLFFMSVREKLQFTVSLDHPVAGLLKWWY